MAYTKIKAIHVRLDRCVDYAVNPEKTASLSDALDYIEDTGKTEECLYVSAFNCGAQTAYADMMATKRRWNKAGRKKAVLGYHLIQSFAPGEVTPEQAHEYGKELAARLLAGKYEAVVSTHLDREHLHNHIVFNSVSFVDGRMYRNSFKDYFGDIRGTSDAICRENDLSVIVPKDKGKHYSEWQAEKNAKPTIRSMIRRDIDEIILSSFTFKTFLTQLERYGYTVKYGDNVKYIAVKPKGGKRFIRLNSLGDDYTEEAIKRRLEQIRYGEIPVSDAPAFHTPPKRYRVKSGTPLPKHRRKLKGFAALYFRYLYLLGKVKRRKLSHRTAFLLREDLLQFDRYVEQFRFLMRNEIADLEGLRNYADRTQEQIDTLKAERNKLYAERRSAATDEERAAISEQIAQRNETLRQCRKELSLCRRTLDDSQRIAGQVQAAQTAEEAEQLKAKEEKQYEHRRRRG